MMDVMFITISNRIFAVKLRLVVVRVFFGIVMGELVVVRCSDKPAPTTGQRHSRHLTPHKDTTSVLLISFTTLTFCPAAVAADRVFVRRAIF